MNEREQAGDAAVQHMAPSEATDTGTIPQHEVSEVRLSQAQRATERQPIRLRSSTE